ncbi:MAG TPA: MCE family protein [Aeromicrobium sp.]|nr:MCE family protein [Aeromicrobium sp.]
MARTSTLDKPGVVRMLGVVMIGLIAGSVFITYAAFTKLFSDDIPVTIQSNGIGLQLSENADVKLRGVIVGRVDSITSAGGVAIIHSKIDPAQQPYIPANVEAYIVPKTLFGEKFVELRPGAVSTGKSIQAGDKIVQGELPSEVEELLVDLDPLLTALNPKDLSLTLTAVSGALSGNGESVGTTLTTLSAYLKKMTPLADEIVKDVALLGDTAQTYADVMPEIGQTLSNAVVTGNTITAKRAQLQALFTETAAFATSAENLVDSSGADFITLSKESRPALELLDEYSPTLGCVLTSIDQLMPAIDNTFRDNRAHVSIEFAARSPRQYTGADKPRSVSGGSKAAERSCATLPNPKYNATRPAPGLNNDLLRALGISSDLGKRAPLTKSSSASSLAGGDLEAEQIDAIVGAALGVSPEDVPDVAQPLFGPVLRGAEVSFS